MREYEEQFLYILSRYINGEGLPDGYRFDVGRVFSLSLSHNVLPMIYEEALYSAENVSAYKKQNLMLSGMQIKKNYAFSKLYSELEKSGFGIIILKGPVCASAYPEPDIRLSSDFDLLVSEDKKQGLHDFLISRGYTCGGETYYSNSDGLYLEVKTSLGEGINKIKNASDKIFEGYEKRTVFIGEYRTLSFNDNLIYIIIHAFKHFVGSGFGIRQLADIMLFAEKYKEKIDFDYVFETLKYMNADLFAYNVFNAAEIVFGRDFSFIMEKSNGAELFYDDFISDLLEAGVFGKSSEDRLHSASIVNDAVEKNGKRSLMSAVFPSYSAMKTKYKILKYLPILLPLAWIFRLIEYFFRSLSDKKHISPARSVKIADERIELMKKMGIIKK